MISIEISENLSKSSPHLKHLLKKPVAGALIRAGVVTGGSERVITTVTKPRSRGAPSVVESETARCNQRRPYVARWRYARRQSRGNAIRSLPARLPRRPLPVTLPLEKLPRVFCISLIRIDLCPANLSHYHCIRFGKFTVRHLVLNI